MNYGLIYAAHKQTFQLFSWNIMWSVWMAIFQSNMHIYAAAPDMWLSSNILSYQSVDYFKEHELFQLPEQLLQMSLSRSYF